MATQIAFDTADNYAPPNVWEDGSNYGIGFQPWDFNIISDPGAGFYAGTFIGDPALAGISGLGTNSFAFGLYANPPGTNASATVTRPFLSPLNVGDVFTIDFGLNWDSDNANSYRGFQLFADTVPVLEVYGSNTDDILVTNENDVDVVMFPNYGTNAMRLFFKLVDTTTMQVSGVGRNGVDVFNQNILIANPPDKISFYFDDTTSNIERQMYFDRLNIFSTEAIASPTPTPTNTVTPTPSITPTNTKTPTPTVTPTPSITTTNTSTPTVTPTKSLTPTPTPSIGSIPEPEEAWPWIKWRTATETGFRRHQRLRLLGNL